MPQSGISWSLLPWADIIPRVVLFTHHLMRRRRYAGASEEDLTWSAIEKTLSGVRRWDFERVGIIEHLMGVVSSDLYNAVRKTTGTISIDSLINAEDIASEEKSPEDLMIERSEIENFTRFLKGQDERLAELATVILFLEDIRSSELARLMNLPVPEVDALKRKLRRATEKYSAHATEQRSVGGIREE